MSIKIFAYNNSSKSAKALAKALNCKLIKHENSRYKYKKKDLIINWGSHKCPFPCLNTSESVKESSNKLNVYRLLGYNSDVSYMPEWTDDSSVALSWCKESPTRKLCGFARTVLNGHSGEGIVPFYHGVEYSIEGEVFPSAPLYTKYVPKKREFRVHYFYGRVIDIQEKKKRSLAENVNYQIRSHQNGWVYCRDNLNISESLLEKLEDEAALFVGNLGLTFGAVDIIYNEKEDKCYVLEVNTAPGLEGKTVDFYANAIKQYYSDYKESMQ